MNHVYTIGHSNHDVETFFALLFRHEVDLIVDVRSKPYSSFIPHFNREHIRRSITLRLGEGRYLYEGDALGGLPVAIYEVRKDEQTFKAAIRRVVAYIEAYQAVCLMCTEAAPTRCHRHDVLAPALIREELSVLHILADGTAFDYLDCCNVGTHRQARLF